MLNCTQTQGQGATIFFFLFYSLLYFTLKNKPYSVQNPTYPNEILEYYFTGLGSQSRARSRVFLAPWSRSRSKKKAGAGAA